MADEITYYVLRADNCRFEGMTKEQILTAITQAVETGTIQNVDTGFVTKIKEQNSGSAVTLWVGTQAQYNALGTKEPNCLYIITDDNTVETMQNELLNAKERVAALEDSTNLIDISDAVTIRLALPDGAALQGLTKKYVYSKMLGIVFFHIGGAIVPTEATNYFRLKQEGWHTAERGSFAASAYVNGGGAAQAVFISGEDSANIDIYYTNEKRGYTGFYVDGFYFVRGESA